MRGKTLKGVLLIPALRGETLYFKSVNECREKMKISNTRFYNALEEGNPVYCLDKNGEKKGYFIDEEI